MRLPTQARATRAERRTVATTEGTTRGTPEEATTTPSTPLVRLEGGRGGGNGENLKGTDDKLPMHQSYFQCRAARDASFSDKAVEICAVPGLGNIVGGENPRIGSFDNQGPAIDLCFSGSRVMRGGEVVNQNMSSSFDPDTLICITCEKEHPVISANVPVCICISDQNFVANLSGEGGNCVGVVRLETGNLHELVDITMEIFSNTKFPGGSVLCVGSATHLHREGVTVYAQDWNSCVARLKKGLQNIQVCPLIPLLQGHCPGSLASDLVQLDAWFAKVYDGQTLGLIESWVELATKLSNHTSAGDNVQTYHSVALPVSLNPGAALANHRYLSTGSRRVNSSGLYAKAISELIRVLLRLLSNELGINCNPSGNTVRIPGSKLDTKENIRHIILVGASHMRRTARYLLEAGYRVTECPIPGTIPDSASIAHLKTTIPEKTEPGTAIVFDMFGNFTYRFEQADGSMALPILLGGKYHLLGNVGVCSDESFGALVSSLTALFACIPSAPVVILPPLPRYIGGGCCTNMTHAGNTADSGYSEQITEKVAHLRKKLRKHLGKTSLDGNWVPDTLSGLVPSTEGKETCIKDTAAELGNLFGGDNVHFTPDAYKKLAYSILNGIEKAVHRSAQAECRVVAEKRTHYWRGFCSQRGSKRAGQRNQATGVGGVRGGAGAGRGRGGASSRGAHGTQHGNSGRGDSGRSGNSHRHHHPYY